MHHILEAVHKEGDDGAARPEEEAEHQRYDVGHGTVLVLHVGGDLGKGGGGGGGSMDGSRSCGILLKVDTNGYYKPKQTRNVLFRVSACQESEPKARGSAKRCMCGCDIPSYSIIMTPYSPQFLANNDTIGKGISRGAEWSNFQLSSTFQ